MKLSKLSMVLFGSALAFSSGARAGENNKTTIVLADKVVVDGKSVDPGKYTVEWTGTGSAVQVSLLRGKETVTTFPAHLTEQKEANAGSAYGSSKETDGTRTLTAIYVGGKRYVLELEQKEARQQTTTPGAK